jgi:hypothetical protein
LDPPQLTPDAARGLLDVIVKAARKGGLAAVHRDPATDTTDEV